jgi:Ras-related protein Rab-7A
MAYSTKKKNTLKVVIIGDSGVGKTSLLQRYMNGKFSAQHRATVGADFLSKDIPLGSKSYNLQVWDTAGQERFQSIGSAFYRGSDCCVVVFDITSAKSFDQLETWKSEFINQGGIKNPDTFPFIVLGNKCDRETERKVTKVKAENWCQNNGNYSYFETSAKDNISVQEAFEKITTLASEQVKEEEIYIPNTINLNNTTRPKTNENNGGCAC